MVSFLPSHVSSRLANWSHLDGGVVCTCRLLLSAIPESVGGADTLAEMIDGYDYTRDTPFEHEETLRALEGGLQESHSEEVATETTMTESGLLKASSP